MSNKYSDPILSELAEIMSEEMEAIEGGLFKIMKVNNWIEDASLRPTPKMLFGEFWFEDELCILFADTNLGKSVLAVQIADSISRGQKIIGMKLEAEPQKVLYFDFELSDKQFELRYYQQGRGHYGFTDNFYRAEINPFSEYPEGFKSFEAYLIHSLELAIIEQGAKILIIDNITYLSNETEKARNALPLMKELQALKRKYRLSLLIIAHTPKRDLSKPISRNDLGGSKMLINFCDSSFAIGESMQDKNTRYLKQIKARNTEFIYDSENVCVCTLEKSDSFLGFRFVDFEEERKHLKERTGEELQQLDRSIIELWKNDENLSNREIARRLETNHTRVGRVIEKVKERQMEHI